MIIRGKYLRERKAIRVKRRMKLLIALVILFLVHKIIFSSYSLYESEATSTANIDVAFFTLENEYQTKVISLEDVLPGDTKTCTFTIANYHDNNAYDENDPNSKQYIISETDMKYTLKIRTTTNLPLEYKLYKNQSETVEHLTNILETETVESQNMYTDEDSTIFKYLVQSSLTDEQKADGITDFGEFKYGNAEINSYRLEIYFPEEYVDSSYQNIIECIEISVEASQIADGE